jgi:hypothetical protein
MKRKAANKERIDALKAIAKQAGVIIRFSEIKNIGKYKILTTRQRRKNQLEKERDLADIEDLKKKGVDVRDLLVLNNELYITLEDELTTKRAEEKSSTRKEIFAKEQMLNKSSRRSKGYI